MTPKLSDAEIVRRRRQQQDAIVAEIAARNGRANAVTTRYDPSVIRPNLPKRGYRRHTPAPEPEDDGE